MTEIKLMCTDQVLSFEAKPRIASGGVESTRLQVSFCQQWAGFGNSAVFYFDKKKPPEEKRPLNALGQCTIPAKMLAKAGTIYIGVRGVKGTVTRTSNLLRCTVEQGADEGINTPEEPPPQSVYDEILKTVGENNAAVAAMKTDVNNALTFSEGALDAVVALNESKVDNTDMGNIFHTKDYEGNGDARLEAAIQAAQNSGKPATVVIHGPLYIAKNHYLDTSVPIKFVSSLAPCFTFERVVKTMPAEHFDIIVNSNNVTVFNFRIDPATGYSPADSQYQAYYLEGLKVKSASGNSQSNTDWRNRDWKNTYLFNAIECNIHCRDVLVYGLGGLCDLQQWQDADKTNENYCDYCTFENVAIELPQGVALRSRSNDNGIYSNLSVTHPPKSNTVPALIEIRYDRGSVIHNIIANGGYEAGLDTEPREQAIIRFFNCFTTLSCFNMEYTLSKYAIICENKANVNIGVMNLRLVGGGAVKCSNSLVTVNTLTVSTDTVLEGVNSLVEASPGGRFTLTGYVRAPSGVPLYQRADGAVYNVAQSLNFSATFDKANGTVTLKDYMLAAVNLFDSVALAGGVATFAGFKGGYMLSASFQQKANPVGTADPVVNVTNGDTLKVTLSDDGKINYFFMKLDYIPKF